MHISGTVSGGKLMITRQKVFGSYIFTIIPRVVKHRDAADSLLVNATTPGVHLCNIVIFYSDKVSICLVKNVEWGL